MAQVLVSEVLGNSQKLDGGSMFGNAPKAVWQRWAEPDEIGRIDLACRALLIETDDKKILCETGIGAFFAPEMADRFGVQTPERHQLIENLEKLDVKPDDIDVVVLSHLHFDHAGGLLPTYKEIEAGNNELNFKNAKYLVGRGAWDRAKTPHYRDRASFIPGLCDKLENSGRLVIIDGDNAGDIDERLSFFYSEGHTPGQMHTIYSGDQNKICFAGDLIPGTPWVHLPITMGYDRFPEKLIEEKEQLYQKAVNENWWIFYTHDCEVAMSQVAKNEKGKFAPSSPQTSPTRMAI